MPIQTGIVLEFHQL